MKIIATNKQYGDIEEINDLYWFEEQTVKSFNDNRYSFDFIPEKGDSFKRQDFSLQVETNDELTNKNHGIKQYPLFNTSITSDKRETILSALTDVLTEIDPEILAYVQEINLFSFMATVTSCCGHLESNNKTNPVIGFHSLLPIHIVINNIIHPLQIKFNTVDISIFSWRSSLVYFIKFTPNEDWKFEIDYFINLLKTIEKDRIF